MIISKSRLIMIFWVALLSFLMTSEVVARKGRRPGKKVRHGMGKDNLITAIKDPSAKLYYMNSNAAKITDWSHFESDFVLGNKIRFVCTATGNPRPHITWFKGGVELYGHRFFQVHEWILGPNKIKSKMEIDPATQMDAGYYECQADNKYAVDFKLFRTDFLLEFE